VIRAVLFDLDGTLLRIDTKRFVDAYVTLLTDWFAPRIPRDRFLSSLLRATQRMMANQGATRTNKEVFDEVFYPGIGVSAEEMAAPIAEFYRQAYPTLRQMASADPAARQAVALVHARGLLAVLATQPIFPAIAVRQRMEWAGVADLPFALVTSYETAHACKPHPQYFGEVTAATQCTPAECLFVGNDGLEDATARRMGMHTVIVTDFLTNAGRVPRDSGARRGRLRKLPAMLAALLPPA
jgi:FMN phosphatase YigB (HAD superfamily)